jgi:DNA-binding MarR family transcriptional regulator
LEKLAEKFSVEGLEITREDLLQKLVEQMFIIMKQIHRDISPTDPLLSPPQARLLFTIAGKKEEGISVKELAEKTNVTPGAITQFVDALVKKDLVRRDEDSNDRRIVRLTLTGSAKSKIEKLHKDFLATASRSFDVLSDREIRQLIELLAKVAS